jgi:hypothetical protein
LIGAFEAYAEDFEGDTLLETMMIARAVTWLAKFSIDHRPQCRDPKRHTFGFLRTASGLLIRVSELFKNFIFIITIINSFLKREFVAQCTILETGSQKSPSRQPAAQSQSDRKLPSS